MSNYPKLKKISLASIAAVIAALFLFVGPAFTASAYTPTNATPAFASSPATNPTPGNAVPSTINSKAAITVVTDLSSDDLQVIQGTKFIGEIATTGVTIGAAFDSKNGLFYVGGYGCECVYVVNAAKMSIVKTISLTEPAAGVTYSAKSGYVYAETFSAPGYYAVINPTTNKVVKTIDACGYYPEFIDVNIKTGAVYAANRETSSGYGCVDEIVGTKIVATASLSDDYGVGISVNQKTGNVLVNGFDCECVYVFTSALKYDTTISLNSYVWGAWSNQKDATNLVPAYYSGYTLASISATLKVKWLNTTASGDDGCSGGTGKYATDNYVPAYSGASGVVYLISKSGKIIAEIQTEGSYVIGCATS